MFILLILLVRIDVIVNITGSCPVNKGANPLSAFVNFKRL
jgi:hypothetical protein